MKEINFKIIDLPTHQILIQKDFENEEKEDLLFCAITFFFDGIKINIRLNYNTEEERNQYFDQFNEEEAQQILNNIKAEFI